MAGLTPFYNASSSPQNLVIACIGDSTTYGVSTANNIGWPGYLRTLMNARWGTGSDGVHLIDDRNWTASPGFYYSNNSNSYDGTTWKQARSTDVWDVSLASSSSLSHQGCYLGSTSSMTATWTKPSYLTVNGFNIWVCDGPSSGNFSYSLSGGIFWTDVSATWNHDNSIKRIFIPSAVTGTNTVWVRGANAAGTSVNCYLLGLEPLGPANTFTVHDFGASGQTSGAFVRTTSGNWHAILDTLQPQLVTYMMTNDSNLTYNLFGGGSTDVSGWAPNIQAIANVVTGYGGSMLFMNFFEQLNRFSAPLTEAGSDTAQANYRALVKTTAASYGMPCIDFYDLVGNGQATIDAGYINPGSPNPYTGPTTLPDIHPNDAGATFIAQKVWNVLSRSNVGTFHRK